MPTTAHAAAAELRIRRPGIGANRLNNLLYLCQGHHLTDLDEPLYVEPIFAVAGGVVVDDLADDQQQDMTVDQLNTIGYVISRYGNLSPTELRTLIRAGDPWQLAAARPDDPRITLAWIQDWFNRAASAAEQDEPKLTREQMTALGAQTLHTTPEPAPARPDTRANILARLQTLKAQASGAP